jgi:spore germination cell wall hydrolase CwlJ-like protein
LQISRITADPAGAVPPVQGWANGRASAARVMPGSPRRWWLIGALFLLPILLLGSARVWGWVGQDQGYAVQVPVTLRPHDPALWSMVNATDFTAARAIDPTLPDPTVLEQIGQVDATVPPPAEAANLRMEAYTGPAANRYVFRGLTSTDTARAHYCLTAALYYEAASETDDGMRGVAQVVLNRVRHPSFPGTVCGVVFQGSQRAIVCQFTFSCDGSMARQPSRPQWSRASRIAAEALAGRVFPNVGMATHYHTLAVWPSWGRSLATTNVIGAHIFHRFRGRWGLPDAFLRPYSGREPAPGPYLSIAAQLAARRGGPAVAAAPGTPGAPLPANIDQATLSAIQAAQAQSAAAQAAAATPANGTTGAAAVAGVQPGVQSLPAAPAARPRPGPPAPTYNDPRLAGSGSIREEFQNSGTAISR